MNQIKVELMKDQGYTFNDNLFSKGSPESVGYDLTYNGPLNSIEIKGGEHRLIGLGIKVEFDSGLVAMIKDRSSYGSRGYHILAGVIDPDYRGEWKVVIINLNKDKTLLINRGDKIAQVLFIPVENKMNVVRMDKLNESERGEKGWGSSGK